MHYQSMLVGQYLKAATFGVGDVPVQPTYTITDVTLEKLESVMLNDTDDKAGKLKTKGIVHFRETELSLVVNRTNAECLAAMFGPETRDWAGKRVTLYAANVKVGGKMDIGIRIKGSPDIDQPITVSVKLPRKKPQPMTMVPTGTPKPVDVEALTADGAATAGFGMEALQTWWNERQPREKAALKDQLPALKAAAAEADAKGSA